MRQEQIIASVARVVITTIREMEAVVLFLRTIGLHRWLQRMPLGMSCLQGTPAYPSSLSDLSSCGDAGRGNPGNAGVRRGILPAKPVLALASCPAGTDLA